MIPAAANHDFAANSRAARKRLHEYEGVNLTATCRPHAPTPQAVAMNETYVDFTFADYADPASCPDMRLPPPRHGYAEATTRLRRKSFRFGQKFQQERATFVAAPANVRSCEARFLGASPRLFLVLRRASARNYFALAKTPGKSRPGDFRSAPLPGLRTRPTSQL